MRGCAKRAGAMWKTISGAQQRNAWHCVKKVSMLPGTAISSLPPTTPSLFPALCAAVGQILDLAHGFQVTDPYVRLLKASAIHTEYFPNIRLYLG